MALLTLGSFGTALAGTTGNAVFVETASGTVMRSRPKPSDTHTAAQARQQYCFAQAQSQYRTLTRAENAQWKQYALSPLHRNPDTGKPGGQTAYAAFVSLSTRYLSLHPNTLPPRTPPEFPYAGDPVKLTVSTLPGQIVLQASAANSPDTRTVIQLLPLCFESQAYSRHSLRVAAVHHFLPADLELVLEVEPGWYVLATHFVNTQTGQWTASTEYEPIEVFSI